MKSRTEKKFDETADLTKYTKLNASPADPDYEYVIGDLHANAFLMLYFFQREGISQFSDEDLEKQDKIYHTDIPEKPYSLSRKKDKSDQQIAEFKQKVEIYKKGLDNYKANLKKTSFNPVKKIHFIGDTLADRGMGDHYVLYNYQALAEKNIPFDIALSNHDLEFIVAYWRGKKGETETALGEKKTRVEGDLSAIFGSSINGNGQVASTIRTASLCNGTDTALIEGTEITNLVETYYLPHVNLISYTLTEEGIVLMTHAPVDFELIRCAAQALSVDYQDNTAAALANTIDTINATFQKNYIQTGKIVDLNVHSDKQINDTACKFGGIRPERVKTLIPEQKMAYIVGALTWNRPTDGLLKRPAKHSGYNLHYVHGHTPTTQDPNHVTNLDSIFGKDKNKYTPEDQSTYKETYGVGYRVLRCEAFVPEEKLKAHLEEIKSICEKLQDRYTKKVDGNDKTASGFYKAKKDAVEQILNEINNSKETVSHKISAVNKLYNDNLNVLEKEHDPTNKALVKALKVILVSLGLVAGVVPGLIALGVFAKSAFDKTGSINFLSDEANKTSQAIELRTALQKKL